MHSLPFIPQTLRSPLLEHLEKPEDTKRPQGPERIETLDIGKDDFEVGKPDDDDVKDIEAILHVVPEAKTKLQGYNCVIIERDEGLNKQQPSMK